MSVRDVAFGLITPGGIANGKTTLSGADTQELRRYVNSRGEKVTINRYANGGCEIGCQDLVRLVLTDDEIEDILHADEVDEETPVEEVLEPSSSEEELTPSEEGNEEIVPRRRKKRRGPKSPEPTADDSE